MRLDDVQGWERKWDGIGEERQEMSPRKIQAGG